MYCNCLNCKDARHKCLVPVYCSIAVGVYSGSRLLFKGVHTRAFLHHVCENPTPFHWNESSKWKFLTFHSSDLAYRNDRLLGIGIGLVHLELPNCVVEYEVIVYDLPIFVRNFQMEFDTRNDIGAPMCVHFEEVRQ